MYSAHTIDCYVCTFEGDCLGFLAGEVGMGSGRIEVGTRPTQDPVVPVVT